MNRILQSLCVIVFTLLITGCKKDNPVAAQTELPQATKGVYVVNEGNWGRANSTLLFYVPDSNKTYPDVFRAANGRGLGDTGNDMAIFNGKGYIVVNTSEKLEVISLETNVSTGTLQLSGKSPYKIAILNADKAYITNIKTASVTVINPSTLAVIKDSVAVGKYPQGLAVANGKVYVCNAGYGSGTTVSVIDAATDVVVKTITVAVNPIDIGVDGDGDVFVLSSGYSDYSNPANDTPGAITVINSNSSTITATIELPLAQYGHPGKLAVSKNGYGYIAGKSAVARFDTKTNTITNGAFIAGNYYSLSVDDVKDQVYVSDAKDYNQNGTVTIYDKLAARISSFTAGVIPGTIAFKR